MIKMLNIIAESNDMKSMLTKKAKLTANSDNIMNSSIQNSERNWKIIQQFVDIKNWM